MSNEQRVIGFFKGFNEVFKKDFLFVDVVGLYEEGKIIVVDDPYTLFPSDGKFYLKQHIGFPAKNTYGVWEIRKYETVRDPTKRLAAEYSASKFEGSAKLPIEVLPLNLDVKETSNIREKLLNGIEVRFPPFPAVLFQLKGGELIGPIHVEAEGDSHVRRVSVEGTSLEKPLGLWPSILPFDVSDLKWREISRKFLNGFDASKPPQTLDLAGAEEAFRSVVRFAWKKAAGESLLNKKQYTQLVEQLGMQADMPPEVRGRAEHTIEILKAAVEAGERLEELAEFLKGHTIFKMELEETKKKAEQEAKEQLLKTRSELNDQIARLQNEEREHKTKIKDLEKQIAEKGKDLLNVPQKVMKAIKEKIEQAKLDPVDLLSQVAILEPFLQKSQPEPGSAVPNRRLLTHSRIQRLPDLVKTDTATKAMERLKGNLKAAGVQNRQAEALSLELIAGIQATRTISLLGAAASDFAGLIADSIAVGNSFRISMPLGITGASDLEQEFESISKVADHSKVCVIIIEGANRSSLELYGDCIKENAYRSLRREMEAFMPVIILNLLKGNTVLAPAVYHSEVGAVFDLDMLDTKVTKILAEVAFGLEGEGDFFVESTEAPPRLLPEEVEGLKKKFCKPSVLFEANVQASFKAMNSSKSGSDDKALVRGLLFGWLIPKALADGVEAAELREGIESELESLESIDPRLAICLRIGS